MDKWPVFLKGVTDLLDARGAYFLYFDWEWNKLSFSTNYGYDHVDSRMLKLYEKLTPLDPRVPYILQHPEKPITEDMCVSRETLHASDMYKQFLKPTGAEYMLFVYIPITDKVSANFGVMRGQESEAFNQGDCDLFGTLIPAVKRSIELHRKLAFLDFGNRAALESFDQLPFGLVLVEEEGRVRFANRSAREISAADDGFSLNAGTFFTNSPQDRSQLVDTIGRMIVSARRDRILDAEGFKLSRHSGLAAYDVVVTTVWGNHIRFELGHLDEPIAAIYITDPEQPMETRNELLRRLFGLTPAEARVVENIVGGRTVAEIANKFDLSQQTVRQHLRVAFEKTGTKRQSQLVKRVLSSPVWARTSKLRKADL